MQLPKLQPLKADTPKKKKILLLGDDFRLPSGIGTISRQIVLKTVDKFDWIQLGAALKHPEHGKGVDISQQIQQETGVEDADVKKTCSIPKARLSSGIVRSLLGNGYIMRVAL